MIKSAVNGASALQSAGILSSPTAFLPSIGAQINPSLNSMDPINNGYYYNRITCRYLISPWAHAGKRPGQAPVPAQREAFSGEIALLSTREDPFNRTRPMATVDQFNRLQKTNYSSFLQNADYTSLISRLKDEGGMDEYLFYHREKKGFLSQMENYGLLHWMLMPAIQEMWIPAGSIAANQNTRKVTVDVTINQNGVDFVHNYWDAHRQYLSLGTELYFVLTRRKRVKNSREAFEEFYIQPEILQDVETPAHLANRYRYKDLFDMSSPARVWKVGTVIHLMPPTGAIRYQFPDMDAPDTRLGVSLTHQSWYPFQ
jgi:hypothetical protein